MIYKRVRVIINILICHSRESSQSVIFNTNNNCIPFRYASSRVLALCMLIHCHGLLSHFSGTEPLLMLLVPPVLFLLYKMNMSAVKKLCKNPALEYNLI